MNELQLQEKISEIIMDYCEGINHLEFHIDDLPKKYELKVKAAQQTSWEDARNAFHTLD